MLTAAPIDPGIVAVALTGLVGAVATCAIAMERARRQRVAPTEHPIGGERAPAVEARRTWWPARGAARDAALAPPPAPTAPRRRDTPLAPGCPVLGYVTVGVDSAAAEAEGSLSAIEARCERSGWSLVEVVHDRENGRLRERPGLRYALERIVAREADGLVVADLHRLSRSIVELGALLSWFRDAGAALIALDLDIDTSTPEGDRVAATLIALSRYEHERIARRTRIGLAEVRARGNVNGRPSVSDRPDLMERIAAMRAAKMTLQAIADQLNAENVPTLRGGAKWRPSSIQAALGYRRPGSRDHLPSLKRRRS